MIALNDPSIGTTRKPKQFIYESQWLGVMRKFQKDHREKCSVDPEVKRTFTTMDFPTGSTYQGDCTVLGLNGFGTYTFSNGVVYAGEFNDGVMHGRGQMHYETDGRTAILCGRWSNGVLVEKFVLFSGDLIHTDYDWPYCTIPDRRFSIEYDNDMKPAGESYMTADQPIRQIPAGYYDTGDGFFDPKTQVVYKYTDLTAIIRSPSKCEKKWILDNCRKSDDTSYGPRQDMYEYWMPPLFKLPKPPIPDGLMLMSEHKKESFDESIIDYENMPLFYDSTKNPETQKRPKRHFPAVSFISTE